MSEHMEWPVAQKGLHSIRATAKLCLLGVETTTHFEIYFSARVNKIQSDYTISFHNPGSIVYDVKVSCPGKIWP